MDEIPIVLRTPGLSTVTIADPEEYPFTSLGASEPKPAPGPVASAARDRLPPEIMNGNTMSTCTDATQTGEDEQFSKPVGTARHHHQHRLRSPNHSRSPSPAGSRKTQSHANWASQIRSRLANSHAHRSPVPKAVDSSGRTMLAPPTSETPLRPSTPAADLYHGQSDQNFGMSFDSPKHAPHIRRGSKPDTCAFSYEDQKHRMLMDWVERRT